MKPDEENPINNDVQELNKSKQEIQNNEKHEEKVKKTYRRKIETKQIKRK